MRQSLVRVDHAEEIGEERGVSADEDLHAAHAPEPLARVAARSRIPECRGGRRSALK
jgi:hypothetical protein